MDERLTDKMEKNTKTKFSPCLISDIKILTTGNDQATMTKTPRFEKGNCLNYKTPEEIKIALLGKVPFNGDFLWRYSRRILNFIS